MISEYNLTDEEVERLRAAVDDLKDQADFYGMDIDYETVSLTDKSIYSKPTWKERWEKTRNAADFDEYIDLDQEDK